ncbi:hypothetical protein EJP77_01355 [Paenibacillus zeisoli]|uniref:Uncharacterized protein n=1 Tax=Paenibacillus zeisoli TaxID=2496267 RepID=A0A433XNS4_9BACL|nr:ribosomal protein L7/L12 [Paenibacillus zeisoli]RUT35694.1 hypothetical protein EJP77_01355 [Paenibacillus zeisoli]
MGENWITYAIVLVFIILFDAMIRMNRRIRRSESKLEWLKDHSQVPEYPLDEELRQLIRDKEKIQAIKKAKQQLGLSLKEAKDYVDAL